MHRAASLLVILACATVLRAAVPGNKDAAFDSLPFEQWLTHPDQSHVRWSVGITEPSLSTHQRLAARVYAQVDGHELAKRRGEGELLVLVQISDERGHKWQNHQEMDLERVEAGIKASDAIFSQLFFALPGDYRVAVALYDTATHEHTINKRRLHVPGLKNDPLPDAWKNLPAIEFVTPSKQPDSWYLPDIDSSLNLGAKPREPVQIDLVVNLTPSERLTGSTRAQNRNLSALLPATKILSQVDWGGADFSLSLLDLARRKVTYREENKRGIDWPKASASLAEVNPALIDVKSLENRSHSAQFFVDDISRRIADPGKRKVLIVLSSVVEFLPGQEIAPLAVPVPLNARVFYIRYQTVFPGRPGGRGGAPPPAFPFDQLAPLLKPLDPRLFEVHDADQFRKALAAILAEISTL